MKYQFDLIQQTPEEPAQNQLDVAPEQVRKAEQRNADIERAKEAYKRWQDATRETEEIQADILKGVQADADITQLFLKAVLAVALATDNMLFYQQIADTIYQRTGVMMNR